MSVVLPRSLLAIPLLAVTLGLAPGAQAKPRAPVGASAEEAVGDNDATADHTKDSGPPTLFGKGTPVGGYGGFSAGVTRLNGSTALLTGGEGAAILGRRLVIGFAAFGTANRVEAPALPDTARGRMQLAYGGLLLRYQLFVDSPVYPSVGALLGGGIVAFTTADSREVNVDDLDDPFFLAEPQVGLHANLFRWMRLSLLGGYRFVQGTPGGGLQNSDLYSPSVSLGLHFGWL